MFILLALWGGSQVGLADGFRSPTLRAETGLQLDIIGRICDGQRGRTLGPVAKGELLPPKAMT